MTWLKNLVTGGLFGTIEGITKEIIDTPLEKAQAQVIKLKAIDPNGKMRREISATTNHLYKVYMYIMMVLLLSQAFELGNPEQIAKALSSMVDLFVPITTGWGTIMTATFGVNSMNSYKGK
jgi:hypothetical protein